MRIGQTSAIFIISKFATSIIGFFATIYFTRTLGDEIYGLYAITLSLVSWLAIVKSVGFGQAIIKRMSEGDNSNAYFSAGLLLRGSLTAFLILGVVVFQKHVNAYVGRSVAPLVVLLLTVSLLGNMVSVALKGTRKVHVYAPLTTLQKISRSAFMVGLVFIGWELSGMLLGYALGTVVMALVGFWYTRPKLIWPERRHFASLLNFAKYSWLGSMRKTSFRDADIIVLGLFVSASFTGIYSVTFTLSKFLEIIGSSITTTLFPEMSKLSAEENTELVGTLTEDALTFAGIFLIPGIVGAAILGDRLLLVYGSNFGRGHWILVIVLVGILIYTYTKQILNTLNAVDRPNLAFRANGVFMVSNIVLNLVLVWQIGWYGAAFATALSATFGFIFSFNYLRSQIDFHLPVMQIGLQCAAALMMGLVVFEARQIFVNNYQWVRGSNAIMVVSLVGLGAIVYMTILVVISRRFRVAVRDNLEFN